MAPGQAKSADDSLSKEIELFTKLAGPAVLGQLFMFLLWMQNAMVGDINNACKDNTALSLLLALPFLPLFSVLP